METKLTEENVKDLAQWLDDKLDFDEWINGFVGNIIEMGDGWAFKLALEQANEKLIYKIPYEFNDDLNNIVALLVVDDYEGTAYALAETLAEAINTPIGNAPEKYILQGILLYLVGFLEEEEVDPNAMDSVRTTIENL